jgi:hypothetical protein
MSKEIPLSVQIAEIERELKMREKVYRGHVERGTMKHDTADKQMRIMREVLVTLRELHQAQSAENAA